MAEQTGAEVAFGGALDIERWSRLLDDGKAPIQWWRLQEGAELEGAFTKDEGNAPYLPLAVRDGDTIAPVTNKMKLTGGCCIALAIDRTHRWIVFGGALFTSVALVGISFIKVDNYLLEDLSEDDPYRKNFEYFENNYSGVRPFELIVTDTTNNNVFSFENLHALDRIEHSIYQNYPVKVVESPLFFVKFLNQISNGNDKAFFKIPETKSEFLKLQKYMKGARFRKAMDSFISEDKKQLRFSCRMKDLGGNEMGKRNEKLLSCVAQLENEHLEVKLTGMSLLIDKNNETLAAGMMESLLVAFGIIAILMGWLFRSVQMVLITLIPNILPLVGIAGVMGFSGIDLKVSTSIIFTIAFGIAVDDTIHYVSKLKVLLNNGRSLPYAMKRTGISTGKAIVVTSLILISGFVTLIFSTFASTFYIGLLVSITLFLAIVFDLLLLPSLIIVFYKKRSK